MWSDWSLSLTIMQPCFPLATSLDLGFSFSPVWGARDIGHSEHKEGKMLEIWFASPQVLAAFQSQPRDVRCSIIPALLPNTRFGHRQAEAKQLWAQNPRASHPRILRPTSENCRLWKLCFLISEMGLRVLHLVWSLEETMPTECAPW
jgi:hypothetical protein